MQKMRILGDISPCVIGALNPNLGEYNSFLFENTDTKSSQFCAFYVNNALVTCGKVRPDWNHTMKIRAQYFS